MASKSGKCPTSLSNQINSNKKRWGEKYHSSSNLQSKTRIRLLCEYVLNPTCKEAVISTILQMLNVCHSSQKKVIYNNNGWNGSHNVLLHFLKVFSSDPTLRYQPSETIRALLHTAGSMNCYYLSRGQLAPNIRDLKMPVPSDPKKFTSRELSKRNKNVCQSSFINKHSLQHYRGLREASGLRNKVFH